jgi:hypothetical protein
MIAFPMLLPAQSVKIVLLCDRMRRLLWHARRLQWRDFGCNVMGNSGSACVSRAGFGVAPKQSLALRLPLRNRRFYSKVRDREDALANTPDARAPQRTANSAKQMRDPRIVFRHAASAAGEMSIAAADASTTPARRAAHLRL